MDNQVEFDLTNEQINEIISDEVCRLVPDNIKHLMNHEEGRIALKKLIIKQALKDKQREIAEKKEVDRTDDLRKKLNAKIHKKTQQRLSIGQMTANTVKMINSNKYDYNTIVEMYESRQEENKKKRETLLRDGNTRKVMKRAKKSEERGTKMAEEVSNQINQDNFLHNL